MLFPDQIGRQYKTVIVNKPALQAWLLAWTTGVSFPSPHQSSSSYLQTRKTRLNPLMSSALKVVYTNKTIGRGRYRRLSQDYEYPPATSESVIYAAMSRLMLRRFVRTVRVRTQN